MTEEPTSPVVHHGLPQPEQDELLLQRQRLLQEEAQSVLKELNVIKLLSAGESSDRRDPRTQSSTDNGPANGLHDLSFQRQLAVTLNL